MHFYSAPRHNKRGFVNSLCLARLTIFFHSNTLQKCNIFFLPIKRAQFQSNLSVRTVARQSVCKTSSLIGHIAMMSCIILDSAHL